jgi:hypothetical protein
MSAIELSAPANSHLLHVVNALLSTGWTIKSVPVDGRLARNGQKFVLKTEEQDIRFRLFVYKVGESGRNKPEERRIEMTSKAGLIRVRSFPDVVLGVEVALNVFVGFNAARLLHGGMTHNASSFFNIDGLSAHHHQPIRVDKRKSKLFPSGVEHHAFFSPDRIAEYLFNRRSIHSGTYDHEGAYSGQKRTQNHKAALTIDQKWAAGDELVLVGPTKTPRSKVSKVDDEVIARAELGDFQPKNRGGRKTTPEELAKIMRAMEENGKLGEAFVIHDERRRLRLAGLNSLADGVRWVSLESVGEGYDIQSFEDDGAKRFIEVKTSVGSNRTFDMSDNEWRTACRLGNRYYIYRVSNIRSKPSILRYQDPRQLEEKGLIKKIANGWRVVLE